VGELFSGRFAGFGPSSFRPNGRAICHEVHGSRASELRAGVRGDSPRCPGVYGMIDPAGALIYVGKAKSLRARLLTYFRPRSRDPKAGRMMQRTRAIVWEPAHSEFAALLRELELIQYWQPRFNVHGQPWRRRRTYVCLGRRPVPYLYLQRRPSAAAIACFGPVPASWRAREAVRRLNDWFRLRDCPQSVPLSFSEQRDLFPLVTTAKCLRYEIETCLGPCVSACSRGNYMGQVRKAREFLTGQDLSVLRTLESAMAAAAAELAFERAGALRDRREVIGWLHDRLERLRQAQDRHHLVYPVAGPDGVTWWYLIERGRVAAVIPEPRTARQHAAASERIESVYFSPRGALRAPELDHVLLISSWFRRRPNERARCQAPAEMRQSWRDARARPGEPPA
jgi:excinuclease ABC subunit C